MALPWAQPSWLGTRPAAGAVRQKPGWRSARPAAPAATAGCERLTPAAAALRESFAPWGSGCMGEAAACHAATACSKVRASCASDSKPGGRLAKLAAGSSPASAATAAGAGATWSALGGCCACCFLADAWPVHVDGGGAPPRAALPGRLAATTCWAHSAGPGSSVASSATVGEPPRRQRSSTLISACCCSGGVP